MPSVEISADELKELRALAKAAPGLKIALEKSIKRAAELDELVNTCVLDACKEFDRRLSLLEDTVPSRLEEVERRLDEVKRQLDALEWRQRKPNFLVTNLPESQGENPQATEKKVKKFLEEKLSLDNIDINNCHRVGKASGERPRRVLVTTTSVKQKQEVFRRRAQLRGTNVFLDDDLPESLRQQREDLRRLALPLAKRKGERLTLSYPYVAARVGQRSYTQEELKAETENEQETDSRGAATGVDGEGEKAEEKGGKRRRSGGTMDSEENRRMKQMRIGDPKSRPLKYS